MKKILTTLKIKNKIYREEHKDEIIAYREEHKECQKQYREENIDYFKEYNKQYRKEHKEQLNTQQKQKFDCDCGGKYTVCNKARHLKSKIHKLYLENET